jgi:hypothetical protein
MTTRSWDDLRAQRDREPMVHARRKPTLGTAQKGNGWRTWKYSMVMFSSLVGHNIVQAGLSYGRGGEGE